MPSAPGRLGPDYSAAISSSGIPTGGQGGAIAVSNSSASPSKARPMASSSLASSKLAMPCAKRKHRWASPRKVSARRGGASSSEERQRINSGKIDDGSDPGYLMARHASRDRSSAVVSNSGQSARLSRFDHDRRDFRVPPVVAIASASAAS